MENVPRVSGFREALPDSNENSWSSRSYPPSYQPWPDSHGFPTDPASAGSEPLGSIYTHASLKERPMSPEIQSPGLESVWSGEGDKEVFTVPPVEPDRPVHQSDHEEQKPNRMCGMRRSVLYAILALVLVIAIALGVGLGVGLGRKKASIPTASMSNFTSPSNPTTSGSPEYTIGGALNPVYYSKSGAFNGSGIALASQSFDGDTHGNIVAYFQHHSGQIRWMQLDANGEWLGGSLSEVVAAEAKNGTPISAVSYVLNGSSTWHVFYLDVNSTVRQRSNSNTTNVWVDGPVNAQNLVANDADQVGMQACWYGNDYGDVDYVHTPLPQNGDSSNSSVNNFNEYGMHLWYASDDSTFQQMGWRQGDNNWTFQGSWLNKDGHAGVGCYSWGPGSVNYVMFVNKEDTVEFWWKDTDTNLTSTGSHPINTWTNTSIAINNVHPSTSLGYTNIFYAQDAASDSIMGYNISWAAENTSIVGADTFTVDGTPGLPGTHLSVTALPSSSGGNNLLVFYQTNGTDMTEFTRDIVSGQWTDLALPIPDD